MEIIPDVRPSHSQESYLGNFPNLLLTALASTTYRAKEPVHVVTRMEQRVLESSVKGTIELWEGGEPMPTLFPHTLQGRVSILGELPPLRGLIEAIDAWLVSGNVDQWRSAFELYRDQQETPNELEFSFDSSFFSAAANCGFLHRRPLIKKLLSTMFDVLVERRQNQTHPLRCGQGGDDDQVRQDGFSAWRRDIDYEYHLHYWKSGRLIQFASIGPHNDFKIPRFEPC